MEPWSGAQRGGTGVRACTGTESGPAPAEVVQHAVNECGGHACRHIVHHTRGVLGRKAAYVDRRTVNAAGSCSNHALVDGGGVATKGDLR